MSLKSIFSMGILLAAMLVIAYTWAPHDDPRLVTIAERTAAEDFTLTDAIGNDVTLSDYKGQVVLLNFWATWCAPCRTEIPWFIDFEKEYGSEGLAVVGVSLDEDGWDVVGPYVAQQRMNYRIVVGDDDLAHQFEVDALPTSYILDRDGNIAAYHQGLVSRGTYESQIKALLAEGQPDPQTAELR